MTNPELVLMQSIRAKYASAIVDATTGTSISEPFLAALIGNESDGDPTKKRFEKNVLAQLWETVLDRSTHFGSIDRVTLMHYIGGFGGAFETLPGDAFDKVDELATSWGLTQIMGYHVLEWIDLPGFFHTIDDLRQPASNLKCAAFLLTSFAKHFSLDVSRNFADLFRCWNTGRPNGVTFDPAYVPNGLARMDLYRSIETGGNGGTT